jgi:hypothetical protein
MLPSNKGESAPAKLTVKNKYTMMNLRNSVVICSNENGGEEGVLKKKIYRKVEAQLTR